MNDERRPLLTPSSSVSVSPRPLDSDTVTTATPTSFRWKSRTAAVLVLATETLERTAFYGLLCNLFMFLNSKPLNWTSYNAATVIFVLNGLSYATAIFGGWLADACFGKFYTILTFFAVYIVGFIVWPCFDPYPWPLPNGTDPEPVAWCRVNYTHSSPNHDDPDNLTAMSCWWAVYTSIVVIAIGYGVVRVNIIPFGAEQVSHEGPHVMRAYFNWLYWCINIGALLAFGVLGYFQQEYSYFWGYVSANAILVVAIIIFLAGSCIYSKPSASGSPITTICKIFAEALRIRHHQRRRRDAEILTSDVPQSVPCCLDYAKVRYGGSFHDNSVDEIKVLGKIVLVFLSMIPYWLVYYQMQTTFTSQALHMRLDFDDLGDSQEAANKRPFKVPAAWLSLFDVVFVLLLLPVLDRVVYPFLDRKGMSPSLRVRMVIGMVFSAVAICVAGGVEKIRLDVYWFNGTNHTHWQKIGYTYYEAADMSVLYQVPQFVLIGVGELFTNIAGLELAYIYAPRSMQSIIMALYWFSQGLGAILGSGLIKAFQRVWFQPYDHGNINCDQKTHTECHLDFFFYFIGGIQVLGIILFVLVAWGLDIGRPVPVRVQRQGHTLIWPRDVGESGDSARWTPQTLVHARPINRVHSGNDAS